MSKRVSNFLGFFLVFMGFSMLIPLVMALAYGEINVAKAFLVSILLVEVPGTIISLLSKHRFRDQKLRLRDTYFIVSSAWIIASAVGALPFFISGAIPNIIDAIFETSSGFTTTGATILEDVEALPKSLLFWRSFTQWLGGMGIMVLFIALLPDFGIKARNIASAETPGPVVTKLSSHFSGTARRLYLAYTGLTVLLVFFLLFGNLTLFDAVTHAMTTMATGGLSTHNSGIASFHSNYVSWVLTIFMFLAGTNFALFFFAASQGIRSTFKDEEFKAYFYIAVVSSLLIMISLLQSGQYTDVFKALTDASFQTVTIMTTTGFNTANFVTWPPFCQMIIVLLMLSGASSGSTSGGIKVVRIVVIFKMIKREIKQKIHGHIVNDIKLNGKNLLPETLTYILSFVTMYILVVIICTLLISIGSDSSFVSNFTATISCVSNVGPGLDQVGPVSNYHFYTDFGKFVLSLAMIAGRLELTTFFIIFSKHFWNPYRT